MALFQVVHFTYALSDIPLRFKSMHSENPTNNEMHQVEVTGTVSFGISKPKS